MLEASKFKNEVKEEQQQGVKTSKKVKSIILFQNSGLLPYINLMYLI